MFALESTQQGVLITFPRVLSRQLSLDATPDQRRRRWHNVVKGDILSKLGKQPLCNGCTTLTVSLAQMTTVWPGPRHLYFVTLTPSAAVFRSSLIFFFLPPLFTPPHPLDNQANWYCVAQKAAACPL